MKLTIQISTANAAFEDDPCLEVKRIIETLVRILHERGFPMGDSGPLIDINGNKVGAYNIK